MTDLPAAIVSIASPVLLPRIVTGDGPPRVVCGPDSAKMTAPELERLFAGIAIAVATGDTPIAVMCLGCRYELSRGYALGLAEEAARALRLSQPH